MSKVLLCLGSNRDALRHINAAQNMLRRTLGDIRFSQSLWTKPIGTATPSPLYLNCLAQADTNLGYPALHQMLKDMERTIGSTPTERKQGIVSWPNCNHASKALLPIGRLYADCATHRL